MGAQNLILLLDVAATALQIQTRIVSLIQQYGSDIPDSVVDDLRKQSQELFDEWNGLGDGE